MNSDLLLIILKYTGGFIAAAYGVYATLTDFREEKDGKKILSKKGYIGIALLITSSVLALSTDAFTDYNEKQKKRQEDEERTNAAKVETKRIEEARNNEHRILEQLGVQLDASKETSSDLKLALKTLASNTETTQGISTDLGTQLAITKGVSRQLGGAVTSLNQTSQATNVVLEETLDRIDTIDMYVAILIDPLAFKDSSGKSILSDASLKLLEDDKKGAIDLSTDEEKTLILNDLRQHSGIVRSTIFSNWSVAISLAKKESTSLIPEIVILHQGESGVSGFLIIEELDHTVSFNKEHRGYRAVICGIKYSIPPNRYTGIRKFNDLNGATWEIALEANENIMELHSGYLSVGGGHDSHEMSKGEIKKVVGGYRGETVVPENHFKRMSRDSKK